MGLDLTRLTEALGAEADVVFAYLFGSQATGKAGPRSDIDVAVYLRDGVDAFETRLRLERRAAVSRAGANGAATIWTAGHRPPRMATTRRRVAAILSGGGTPRFVCRIARLRCNARFRSLHLWERNRACNPSHSTWFRWSASAKATARRATESASLESAMPGNPNGPRAWAPALARRQQ